MLKKTVISKILKCFPSLEAFLLKLKRRFFLPKECFTKNEAGFLELNPAFYPQTLINFYHALIPLYAPTCHKKAKQCLQKALENRKHYTPENLQSFQLFIDISALVELDFGTGIQRVVRNILSEFLAHPPKNYRVQPVYANREAIYRHTESHQPIDVFPGDIFLGLDLAARWTNRYWDTFDLIKAYGGKLYFIIYDILPVQHPQFFSFKLKLVFKTWLKQICTQADGVVCISQAVANELVDWLQKNPSSRQKSLKIGWFHLGAEMDEANKTSVNKTEVFDQNLNQNLNAKSILMVGTVEPRKDYTLALAAFNDLWKQDEDINLIIVGKQGWKIDKLIKILKRHPQKNIHLFWFEKASDALLLKLYQSCQGLLMTSQCEGFGLPLIEAARHNLPILARDIPVFREVAQEHVRYFPFNATAAEIAEIIKMWLIDINKENAPLSKNMPWLSWSQSMKQLTQVIIDDHWYTFIHPKNYTLR
jgi:glycosyltransferase involved in cell wall biosynthesis